jgi:hypothetical protein
MRRLCKPSSVGRVQIGQDLTDGQVVINRGLLEKPGEKPGETWKPGNLGTETWGNRGNRGNLGKPGNLGNLGWETWGETWETGGQAGRSPSLRAKDFYSSRNRLSCCVSAGMHITLPVKGPACAPPRSPNARDRGHPMRGLQKIIRATRRRFPGLRPGLFSMLPTGAELASNNEARQIPI